MQPITIHTPQIVQQPSTVSMQYAVRTPTGWLPLDRYGTDFKQAARGSYLCTDASCIFVPVDPLTAIQCGAVTVEELGLPEGLKALFNILK